VILHRVKKGEEMNFYTREKKMRKNHQQQQLKKDNHDRQNPNFRMM
jgi:hypothetical protein